MKNVAPRGVGSTLWSEWVFASMWRVRTLTTQIYRELKRLNRGGDASILSVPTSRRERTRAFKAALVRQYHDHNRCC